MDSFLELLEPPQITQHLLRQQHRLRAGILAISLRKILARQFGLAVLLQLQKTRAIEGHCRRRSAGKVIAHLLVFGERLVEQAMVLIGLPDQQPCASLEIAKFALLEQVDIHFERCLLVTLRVVGTPAVEPGAIFLVGVGVGGEGLTKGFQRLAETVLFLERHLRFAQPQPQLRAEIGFGIGFKRGAKLLYRRNVVLAIVGHFTQSQSRQNRNLDGGLVQQRAIELLRLGVDPLRFEALGAPVARLVVELAGGKIGL